MKRPTKMEERELFIAEFARRLREAPPGMRVFMRVGDVFKDAEIVSLDEHRATRRPTAAPGEESKPE